MTEIAEHEARLAAALDRIEDAVSRVETGPDGAVTPEAGDVAKLRAALETERAAKAQLIERVSALRDKQETVVAGLERRVAQLTDQLDRAATNLARQTALVTQLTETNRTLREAAMAGIADGAGINRAMEADLEALDALRAAERAEIETVLGEVRRLIGEGADA